MHIRYAFYEPLRRKPNHAVRVFTYPSNFGSFDIAALYAYLSLHIHHIIPPYFVTALHSSSHLSQCNSLHFCTLPSLALCTICGPPAITPTLPHL